MSNQTRLRSLACLSVATISTIATGALANPCSGPGAPTNTDTKCVTGIFIPGNPLRSFDISWVNPDRGEYYLGDRSNSGIDIIDTHSLKWKRTIGGFVGIVLNGAGAVDNNHSGPDGVTSHGRWLYAGDGNSTLKVIDLDAPPMAALQQSISTGGTTRVDEMALTTEGDLLLAANNAEDPPFGTLFAANGDDEDHDGFWHDDHDGHHAKSNVKIITKVSVDATIIPPHFGLSFEQPAWDPKTRRFLVSIPIIANNPTGCNYGQVPPTPPSTTPPPITCHGGVMVINPETLSKPTAVIGAFNAATNTGVIALNNCGPNGASVGPDDNVILGCTPQNNPSDVITLVINAKTKAQTPITGITGSDEVWYNSGDGRYYTGSSRDCKVAGTPCPTAGLQAAVLGVIDAEANTLVEKVPQSTGSHSVAADSELNRIFVPQVAPASVVGSGGDTTTVGAGICGTNNGCVAVYQHGHGDHDHDHDHDHGDNVADR
jgi:hypothetical protein